jgi:folate-binding protein YgfZ
VSPNLANLSESDWQLGEVLSGISMVQAATTEAFVPQMLNYESVNGVSFKKGCYPGQEVVARSQFRGTLKRRAYVVSADAPMTVGQEIFASEDETQSCGMVSSAAVYVPVGASEPQSFWGIVSMQTTAADQPLHLGSSQGHKLNVHALPYALLEDI